MSSLSVILITKNEESQLAACLESLKWADEIIVLDSGSTDKTLEIAKHFNAKVFSNTEWPGYGKQRQIAQTYATCDWVFMIDADEVVSSELTQEIQAVVKNNDQRFAYNVPRLSWVFGRFIKHSGWYPDYVIRLYPKNKAGYDDALVHEKVILSQGLQVKNLGSDLLHYTYRDLHHYLVKSAGYAKLWADQRQAKGKKTSLLQASIHALGCFIKMYIVRLGFLDGKQGLLLALLSSHSTFVKYADLWVRRHDAK